MPRRDFHRSQSAAIPPSERAYLRAQRELRDCHRARSLDVILEEDHHLLRGRSKDDGVSLGILAKRGAVLCLADLANEPSSEEPSESNADCETADFVTMENNREHGWGHFTADSPSESRGRPLHIPVPAASARTMRRFGRS